MILHGLKKSNDPQLWVCFKVGYAAEDGVSIIDAGDLYFRKRKVKNRSSVTEEGWRLLTLAYLRASIDAHKGGPWPQYGFPDRTIITYPEAVEHVQDNSDLGQKIVQRNKAHIIGLMEDISKELGESCEVDRSNGLV